MSGGYTRGADGAIIGDTDKSTSFGGTDGYRGHRAPIAGPDVFSVEAWFRPRRPAAARSSASATPTPAQSTNYDRHIYMEPDGRITFGVYNNGSYTVSSPRPSTTASGTTPWAPWTRPA